MSSISVLCARKIHKVIKLCMFMRTNGISEYVSLHNFSIDITLKVVPATFLLVCF